MSATATKPVVTTYVEYLRPGALFSEESAYTVTERNPSRIAREAPDDVFAFRFFDKVTVTVMIGREEVRLKSRAIHETGRYYIDAEELTSADIAALPGVHEILLSNMRSNGWDPILRCRTGNFQPLERGDEIVRTK